MPLLHPSAGPQCAFRIGDYSLALTAMAKQVTQEAEVPHRIVPSSMTQAVCATLGTLGKSVQLGTLERTRTMHRWWVLHPHTRIYTHTQT